MEQINNHSPLPWECNMPEGSNGYVHIKTIERGESVCTCYVTDVAQENAAFIVTACNSYYPDHETISALTERVNELEAISNQMFVFIDGLVTDPTDSEDPEFVEMKDKARALLTPKNNEE